MVKDEWVSAAMADDSVVVELLFRIKESQASSSIKFSSQPSIIPFRWGLRQRRSKISSPLRYDIISHKNKEKEKESTSTRYSPTTPLSWTNDSSSPSSSFSLSSRSKGSGGDEFSSSVMAKRLKRKKALADLKVEECLLLKESVHLKKELASLRVTYKERTTSNESLKKMKLNMNFSTSDNFCDEPKQDISNQPCQGVIPSKSLVQTIPGNGTHSDSYRPEEINPVGDAEFFLPDLNMIPAEDCL